MQLGNERPERRGRRIEGKRKAGRSTLLLLLSSCHLSLGMTASLAPSSFAYVDVDTYPPTHLP